MDSGQMIEWHQLDKQKFLILAPSFFLVVRALVYPFNLIKTRLFMQERKSIYTGTINAFIKILQYEGVRGLYRGYLFNSFGLISGQVYIVTYELVRSRLHGYRTEVKGLVAGGFATLMGQTVTVPVDVITQHRMMAGQVHQWTKKKGVVKDGSAPKLPNAIDITRKILKYQGVRGLFKGYHISLLTYAPNSALWWSFYSGGFHRAAQSGLLDILPLPLVQATVGVTSAVMAAVLTNPMDVLRTRYQVRLYYILCVSLLREGVVIWMGNNEPVCMVSNNFDAG